MNVKGLSTGKTSAIFDEMLKDCTDRWRGVATKLGADLYQAVLSQELLFLLSIQDDEDVSDARIRELIHEGRDFIDAEVNRLFGSMEER